MFFLPRIIRINTDNQNSLIAASLSGSYLSARLRRPLTEPSLKESIAQQSLRDAFGIAASLSDFLCMLPPASPTANESLRDAFGIL